RKGKEVTSALYHVLPRKIRQRKGVATAEDSSESVDASAAHAYSTETRSTANSSKSVPAVIPATKVCSYPEGYGSLGARALHMKVQIDSLDTTPLQGRLDSGADITLMSEDYWKTIAERPPIKEGIRMKLYQLTGQAKVLGYVWMQLFTTTIDGTIASFDPEAYVVQGMHVPLLLGEDFSTPYELGMERAASGHCKIKIGRSG
ncbi:hypothetical protein DXG01_006077, partial [Tephrocybe rancida]